MTNSIDKTPEGHDFNLLANGCRWLAWGLLVPAVVEIILNSIANVHPGFHAAAIVGTNYLYLVVPLVAFSLISSGSHGLLSRTKQQLSISNTKSLILVLVLIGVAYCFLIFRHYTGNSLGSTNNPFHLPLWLMLVTMVIPYLYAWFVGLLAVYEIVLFQQAKSGRLVPTSPPARGLRFGNCDCRLNCFAVRWLNRAKHRTPSAQYVTRGDVRYPSRCRGGLYLDCAGRDSFKENRGGLAMTSPDILLYDRVVRITRVYLGPAADRFIARQVQNHLQKEPQALSSEDLGRLIDWIRVAVSLLTEDSDIVEEYTTQLQELAKP